MPFKRGKYWWIDVRPPGYPYRIAVSTRTTSKRLACQMEATLKELAAVGKHRALDALREGKLALPDIHAAKVAERLPQLLDDRTDELLSEVVAAFVVAHPKHPNKASTDKLLKVAGTGTRASWLLEPDNLRALVRYLQTHFAPNTERRNMAVISVLVRDTFGPDVRGRLWREIAVSKEADGRTRWLHAAEIGRLREVAGDWWVPIALSLSTGIRRGELLRLRRSDINMETGTLVVEHGKSRRARRTLSLEGEVVALLRGFLAAFPAEESDPLFPFTQRQLRIAWDALRVAAKLDDGEVVWNTFRHTYAVHCAKAGMPIPELQVRMGHASIQTTMRYAIYAPAQRTSHYSVALSAMGLEMQQVPTFGPTVAGSQYVTADDAKTSRRSA